MYALERKNRGLPAIDPKPSTDSDQFCVLCFRTASINCSYNLRRAKEAKGEAERMSAIRNIEAQKLKGLYKEIRAKQAEILKLDRLYLKISRKVKEQVSDIDEKTKTISKSI